MKIVKPNFWDKNISFIAIFLLPISLFYQLILKIKKKLINEKSFDIPIICIGNIYLGGTGKTPLAIFLSKFFSKLKKKNAIIKKHYLEHKDELDLIRSHKIKVFSNKSRLTSIKEANKKKYKILIMDDGYQDISIKPVLNILCFNSNQLIGNGMTIPSGPLRESFNSINRSKIILINGKRKIYFENKIKKISKNIKIFYSEYIPQKFQKLKNKKLLVFAGIGNNSNFFDLLKKNKLKIAKTVSFPDHYNYSFEDINSLNKLAAKQNLEIVTTEKDFLRIKKYRFKNIKYISIKLKINKLDEFKKTILENLI